MGMSIIDKTKGMLVGRVADTIFKPGERYILGFTLNCGRWHGVQKAIKIENIYKIGDDAIVSEGEDYIIEIGCCPDLEHALHEKQRVLGLRVVSDYGDELGFLDDILIDERDSQIEGYSITDGIVEDILHGRTIIPYSKDMVFGKDAVIVHDIRGLTLKNDVYLKKVLRGKG